MGFLVLKPLLCKWLSEACEEISADPVFLRYMWEKCGITQAFDPARRFRAMSRQHELFKKPVGDGVGITSDSFLDNLQPTADPDDVQMESEGPGASTAELVHATGVDLETLISDGDNLSTNPEDRVGNLSVY